MAERKHPAICSIGDLYLASGEQPLRCENFFVVAPELPYGLTGQRAGLQFVQILLSHLHCGNDVRPPLGRPFEAPRNRSGKRAQDCARKSESPVYSPQRRRVHWHAELACRRCQYLHFVIEPRHARRIVPGTEIAAGVCGFDPIAAKRVFAAHQGFNASSIVSGGRDLYPPSRISRRRQSMGSGF